MINAKNLKELSLPLNILYAEDEQIIRDGMVTTLEKLFKNTYVATNGQEAIEIFKKEEIDIVLTDINMPIMDGLELIGQINKLHDNPIIIVISAHDETRLLKRLINLEVNNFLNKPVDKDALINILYKNCSIVSNKKLLRSYSKQLEDENDAMTRKNKILEQKLNQIACQTNKIQRINKDIINRPKKDTTIKDNSYFTTLIQDDKDELKDLSQELDTYIMMMFQNDVIHKDYTEKLAKAYNKYASVLSSYSDFLAISDYLHKFSDMILVLEEKFLHNVNQTGIYLESLQMTLETFRLNTIEKEAKDPRFYNASLTNDIELIMDFLESNESKDSVIEFF